MSSENEAAAARLAADLGALGVHPGGVLLMHASLSSLGWVPGGAETVVLGLLRVLGDEGTLLIPALSYRDVDAANPNFDLLKTPACIGAIPEHLCTRPGTLRSVHPTHSVCALGRRAAEIVADHFMDTTPVGEHSPFRRVRDVGGQVLFLGCGMRPDTSMHGVEELVEPPRFLGQTIIYRVALADGRVIAFPCRRHHFAGWRQRYDRLEPLLAPGRELRVGPVLAATAHLLEARALWAVGLAIMQRDPYYFVEKLPGD